MTHYAHHTPEPSREQLAAFADGELSLADHLFVEAWIARHPEAAAEVEAQRLVNRLWKSAQPADPSEAAWARARLRAEQRARTAPDNRQPAARKFRYSWSVVRTGISLGSAAAVVAAVLFLGRGSGPDLPIQDEVDEPFPVATADDVEIISMDPADAHALVVGEPPLREPFVAARMEDVIITRLEPDADGALPLYRTPTEKTSTPMILSPPAVQTTKEPRHP